MKIKQTVSSQRKRVNTIYEPHKKGKERWAIKKPQKDQLLFPGRRVGTNPFPKTVGISKQKFLEQLDKSFNSEVRL